MNENREPGMAKIFVQMPGGNVVRIVAPCRAGDSISYGAQAGSKESKMNLRCDASGVIGNMTIN